MILDTSFLVSLERELRRREEGPASLFLKGASARRFCITPVIAGEMACGVGLAARSAWESLVLPFHQLPHDLQVAWQYGTLYRILAAAGQLIGGNDLWIAASALVHALPVVTRNTSEFGRVPGLQVISF